MTEASRKLGIVSVDKESKKGNHYMVLVYPPAAQKLILEHYTSPGPTETEG